MTEEPIGTSISADQKPQKAKLKREIFRFDGERPTAINLDHVNLMFIEGKKITFQFYNSATFIELADEAAANSVFDVLLGAWVGEL